MMDPELETPIVIAFDFFVELGGINSSPVAFEVPADVEMIDPDQAGF